MSNISQLGWTPPNLSQNTPAPPKTPPSTSISPDPSRFSTSMGSSTQADTLNQINLRIQDLTIFKKELSDALNISGGLSYETTGQTLDPEIQHLSSCFALLSANKNQESADHLEELIIYYSYLRELLTVSQTNTTTIYNYNQKWLKQLREQAEISLPPETLSSLTTEVEIIDAWEESEGKRLENTVKQEHPEWFDSKTPSSNTQIASQIKELRKISDLKTAIQIAMETQKDVDLKNRYLCLNFAEIKIHRDWREDMEYVADLLDYYQAETEKLDNIIRNLSAIPKTPEQRHQRVQGILLKSQDKISQMLLWINQHNEPTAFKQLTVNTYNCFEKLLAEISAGQKLSANQQAQSQLAMDNLNRRKHVLLLAKWILLEVFALDSRKKHLFLSLPYLASQSTHSTPRAKA